MQVLDIKEPELPDLQFVLMVAALCTSDIPSLNLPEELRRLVFDRCWSLLHNSPPPEEPAQRVLDLRFSDETTLEALVTLIRTTLTEHGYSQLTWDHPPSEPTQSTSPEAIPLVERLQTWNPIDPQPSNGSPA
ncbi:MAG: hypothetical protein D6704_06490 [Nitrospirae bacterium]|nr:MAG: hypothetical protein D6704_06490 [Nitrospirota bacterium]